MDPGLGQMQCVVLAGGLASRMRPITLTIPKSLIPVHGRPFIDYQLSWLKRQGIDDIILCIGYKGDMVREFVGDGTKWGVHVEFVDEGENLRGTAGALRYAYEQGVLADRFLLTYGDSFLPISFKAVWKAFLKSRKPALMTVFENDGRWDKSNVRFENEQVVLYDKFGKAGDPALLKFIDYGLSALSLEVVQRVSDQGKQDLAELFHDLSVRGELAGYVVDQRFYEIGSQHGLEDFKQVATEYFEV